MAGTSNYPNGFANGVVVRGVPLLDLHPGKIFWVNGSSVLAEGGIAGADTTGSGTYKRPFATIDYAIGRCTASRGDIIAVMPGHSETVETDGGIALDVAGVAVVGLGTGTLRPKIVLDTAAAAAVTVSAANVSIVNLVLEASFADVTNAIDVTAANLAVVGCEFSEEGANLNFVDIINASSTTDNTADGLHVEGCVSTAIDTAIDTFIVTAADLNRLVVKNNNVQHLNANALHLVEALTGKDLTNVIITDNYYATLDAAGFVAISADTTTANTGVVARNGFMSRDTVGELVATAGTNFSFIENFSSSVIDASGYILPARDS